MKKGHIKGKCLEAILRALAKGATSPWLRQTDEVAAREGFNNLRLAGKGQHLV